MMEILAPAGSGEMLRAAVFAGANAVYLGLESFNARRSAANFTEEALLEAVQFCHARGVRVYVALNTTLYPNELAEAAKAVESIARAGADAVIVQDLAVAALCKRIAPALALHGSTQMSVHTAAGVQALAQLGFTRVILARELSLAEIQYITENSSIEVEVFVHGALCMSISGQCYLSAFFGGRSGNRGSCAGPCRLPMAASTEAPANSHSAFKEAAMADFASPADNSFHLSLKDMSHIPYLPQLASAGVACVKIEGRLRTPEYCAAAVQACKLALLGEEYNTQLLQDVFSRSGFTDSYIANQRDGSMFGVYTEGDSAAAKAALPKLRELYRREAPRVPVTLTFTISADGAKLAAETLPNGVIGGICKAVCYSEAAVQPAEKDPAEAYRRALSKTGGTPFYPADIRVDANGLWFLPAAEVNELRRRALDDLLLKCSAAAPLALTPFVPPHYTMREKAMPRLAARFEHAEQLFANTDMLERLFLPISEYAKIPEDLRSKCFLELPRAMFDKMEDATAALLRTTKHMGFAGYIAENIAHITLAKGQTLLGGFGLNITNPLAAESYLAAGLSAVTLSPELTVQGMALFPNSCETMALAYGHLPLMLTRACPLQNVRGCEGCDKKGVLLDRKRMRLPLRCRGGVRAIYNPVPLYMGDKIRELCADWAVLYFSIETKREAELVLRQFLQGEPFDGAFTRGLYFKGTN